MSLERQHATVSLTNNHVTLPLSEGSAEVSGPTGLAIARITSGSDHESTVGAFVTQVKENLGCYLTTNEDKKQTNAPLLQFHSLQCRMFPTHEWPCARSPGESACTQCLTAAFGELIDSLVDLSERVLAVLQTAGLLDLFNHIGQSQTICWQHPAVPATTRERPH